MNKIQNISNINTFGHLPRTECFAKGARHEVNLFRV